MAQISEHCVIIKTSLITAPCFRHKIAQGTCIIIHSPKLDLRICSYILRLCYQMIWFRWSPAYLPTASINVIHYYYMVMYKKTITSSATHFSQWVVSGRDKYVWRHMVSSAALPLGQRGHRGQSMSNIYCPL